MASRCWCTTDIMASDIGRRCTRDLQCFNSDSRIAQCQDGARKARPQGEQGRFSEEATGDDVQWCLTRQRCAQSSVWLCWLICRHRILARANRSRGPDAQGLLPRQPCVPGCLGTARHGSCHQCAAYRGEFLVKDTGADSSRQEDDEIVLTVTLQRHRSGLRIKAPDNDRSQLEILRTLSKPTASQRHRVAADKDASSTKKSRSRKPRDTSGKHCLALALTHMG